DGTQPRKAAAHWCEARRGRELTHGQARGTSGPRHDVGQFLRVGRGDVGQVRRCGMGDTTRV
ncbi:hypothetical protein HAX54_018646, partial [Datura stramonium]|nr:hypothetical protein [Datura stramonium]